MSGATKADPAGTTSIFEWIQNSRSTGVVGDPPSSSELWKVWARTVQRFGSVFRGSAAPTPEEEEAHYAYHYTNESGGESGTPSAYLEPGSHEWMATALCIFAICKKYVEVIETLEKRCEELDNFLKTYPLEEQERKCREGLVGGDTSNGTMEGDHLLAYYFIFEGIIERDEARVWEERGGFLATLDFAEGYVYLMMGNASSLHGVTSRTLECFQRARAKEPDFYLWWHVPFLVIRALQQNWNILELLMYSRKAHQLAPPQMKIRTGLCWMWAEVKDAMMGGQTYWAMTAFDLIRSAMRDLEKKLDPSECHSKWAARKIAELLGRDEDKPKKPEKPAPPKNSEEIPSHGRKTKEAAPSNPLEARRKIISAFDVECPPVWAADYLDSLLEDRQLNAIPDYLKRRLGQKEFSLPALVQDSEKKEAPSAQESGEGLPAVGSEDWLCTKFCLDSVALLLNLGDSPWNTFENSKVALFNIQNLCPRSHFQAYVYLLKAAILCTEFVKFKTLGETDKEKEERFRQSILRLKAEWKKIRDSAAVYFVRGRLAAVMGLTHDISLGHYRKAARLEPDNCLWQQVLYGKLREIRRTAFSSHAHGYPSDEELAACQKALELSPGNPRYMLDLAMVKLQSLSVRATHESDIGQLTKEADVIARLLSEVLKQAPGNSKLEMMALLKTGELYSAKGLPQRTREAKVIFMKCYRKWPKCSTVLHKVARFYHFSYNNNGFITARNLYEEAMQITPANYPCLMDYLKLYGHYLRTYAQMVKVIDRSLPLIKEPEHVVRVLIIKGLACWLNGRGTWEAACEAWLEVFQNFQWLGGKVTETVVYGKPTPEFGTVDVSPAELFPLFLKACDKKRIDMGRNKALGKFIDSLKKAIK